MWDQRARTERRRDDSGPREDGAGRLEVGVEIAQPHAALRCRPPEITRTSNAPNGERCGPICHVGSVQLTPTGRLVKPSARLRLPRPGRPGIHVIVRGRVTRVSAGRAATAPLVVKRGDPIEVRTDSRNYVRVYVRGHLPPAEWNPFGLARPDGRVWDERKDEPVHVSPFLASWGRRHAIAGAVSAY